MEITVGLFLVLFTIAFVCEFIDSLLGMRYGTILTPTLLILVFNPFVAIPAVLLSQSFGGFTVSVFHRQFKNASFHPGSRDFKIVFVAPFGTFTTRILRTDKLHITLGIIITIKLLSVQKVDPCHCCEEACRLKFKEVFDRNYIDMGVGRVIDIKAL